MFNTNHMVLRFYLYSFFKNLRFADPFLILYFLALEMSYSEIGLLLGLQHLVTVLLEFPSGVFADYWGRRRATAICFAFYSLSFTGFGMTGQVTELPLIFWLGGCLALFALGEALRTGSHKAIMLDYLDSMDQSHLATQLLGRTRSVSKFTSALAAVSGGVLLAWSRDYGLLFYLSAGAAVCGFLLLLTYPRALEGDAYRARRTNSVNPEDSMRQPFRVMWRRPNFRKLFIQSMVFESQLKMILKYFTQPFLKNGLAMFGIPIIAPVGVSGFASAGAIFVGLNEFLRDSLGALGARFSSVFELQADSRSHALNRIYFGGFFAVLFLAGCAVNLKWGLLPGLVLLMVLTLLQNLRRPIFVSALNTEMMKTERASVLSLESVSRAVTVAVLLPLFGWAADQFGLLAVWILATLILLSGFLFKIQDEDVSKNK
ncbi:Major Facilitator Superfamily protein [Gimesia maris]|uniref:MFS transporter n=1 Tax=Gimesia maris TaxID=122 RepID=UPI00118A5204|nr:MFS transporter [Gimesia maris]QDU13986.1 Major Facilitator Superfamily protein [Gimesia maris]